MHNRPADRQRKYKGEIGWEKGTPDDVRYYKVKMESRQLVSSLRSVGSGLRWRICCPSVARRLARIRVVDYRTASNPGPSFPSLLRHFCSGRRCAWSGTKCIVQSVFRRSSISSRDGWTKTVVTVNDASADAASISVMHPGWYARFSLLFGQFRLLSETS